MSRKKRGYRGEPFRVRGKKIHSLQILSRWKTTFGKRRTGKRASLCAFCRGSLTLEASMVLPFFLCAITALLYLFSFTAVQARESRQLMERAQLLAVTSGRDRGDPFVRLYGAGRAAFSFLAMDFGGDSAAPKAVVRAWVGYTGEGFAAAGDEEIVFITPEGTVYHRNRDCTYLRLSVRLIPYGELDAARNHSGGRYSPCVYCIRSGWEGSVVYVTDYGGSYHSIRECRGLRRTVMAVPLSEVGARRACSRCGRR